MLRRRTAPVAVLVALLLWLALPAQARLAFPGCQGDACDALDFSSGKVFVVNSTDCDDDGTCDWWTSGADCTLPEALDETEATKIIVFNVSGDIECTEAQASGLDETGALASNLYINGATAPNEGVQIVHDGSLNGGNLMSFDTGSDLMIRHIAIRADKSTVADNNAFDSLTLDTMDDVILDHVSLGGAEDETLSLIGDSANFTLSRSILQRPIACRRLGPTTNPATDPFLGGLDAGNCREVSAGNYGLLHGRCFLITDTGNPGETPDNVTIHHSYFVGCQQRAPAIAGDQGDVTTFQILNNAFYCWTKALIMPSNSRHEGNVLGNFARPGPCAETGFNLSNSSGVQTAKFLIWPRASGDGHDIYTGGTNVTESSIGGSVAVGMTGEYPDVADIDAQTSAITIAAADAVTTTAADVAAASVLGTDGGVDFDVGRTKPMRDDWDAADVQAFFDKTAAGPVANFAARGGLPDLTDEGSAACADADYDGLCDSVEQSIFGTTAITGEGDCDSDGYSDAEEIINQTSGDHTEPLCDPLVNKAPKVTVDVESGSGLQRIFSIPQRGSAVPPCDIYVWEDGIASCTAWTQSRQRRVGMRECGAPDQTFLADSNDPKSVTVNYTCASPPCTKTFYTVTECSGYTAGAVKTVQITGGGSPETLSVDVTCDPPSGTAPLTCTPNITYSGTCSGDVDAEVRCNANVLDDTYGAGNANGAADEELLAIASGTDASDCTYPTSGTKDLNVVVRCNSPGTAPNDVDIEFVPVGNPSGGGGPSEDGVNALCDCLEDGSTTACINKYGADITSTDPLLVCEDFEAVTFYSPFAPDSSYTNDGSEDIDDDWVSTTGDPSPSSPGMGFGSHWFAKYGTPVNGINIPGGSFIPHQGTSCQTATGSGNCVGLQEWCSADQGNSNGATDGENCWGQNNTAKNDVQRAGDYDALVGTLTEMTGGNSTGGVFDGNQHMAVMHRPNLAGGNAGQANFTKVTEIGMTMAMAFSSNWHNEINNIWAQREKHNEWSPGGGSAPFTFGPSSAGNANTAPFQRLFIFHDVSQSACEAVVSSMSPAAGTFDCSGLTMRAYPTGYDRATDWGEPMSTWQCIRGHISGYNSTSMRWRVWFNDTLIIDSGTFDGTLFTNTGFDAMTFNNFSNSQFPPTSTPVSEAVYRYEDNIVVVNGEPVSCQTIGFP